MKSVRLKKVIKYLAAAVLLSIAFAGLLFRSILNGLSGCEDKVLAERPSPNGWFNAVQVSRDCGATTGRPGYILKIIPSLGPLSGEAALEVCSDVREYDFTWQSARILRAQSSCPFNIKNSNPYFILKVNPEREQ